MSGEITAASWNTRQFDPTAAAYGSAGNHTCLWDIAREQLAKDGYTQISDRLIQAKIDEILKFHRSQEGRPGYQEIRDPDLIGDGQVIFMPEDGRPLPAGTRLQSGAEVKSPDGNTVLTIYTGRDEKGRPETWVYVYRNDGQGFELVKSLQLPQGVHAWDVTSDEPLRFLDKNGSPDASRKGTNQRLVVQNDGNVVLYGNGDEALWATDTQRPLSRPG